MSSAFQISASAAFAPGVSGLGQCGKDIGDGVEPAALLTRGGEHLAHRLPEPGGGEQVDDSTLLRPPLVAVRRTWASWAAPGNSTQAGASITLMVRVTRRPCPVLVTRRAGTSFHGSFLHAECSRGWLPLIVNR